MKDSVEFSTFTKLCLYHLFVVLRYFYHLQKAVNLHFPVPPVPDNKESASYFLDLTILGISYRWNHTRCNILCLASLLSIMFWVHPGCSIVSVLHSSIRLNSISLSTYVMIFYVFIQWRTFGVLPLGKCCEMWECCYEHGYTYICFSTCFQLFWIYIKYPYPNLKELLIYIVALINFLSNQLNEPAGADCFIFPPATYKRSSFFPISLPTLVIFVCMCVCVFK